VIVVVELERSAKEEAVGLVVEDVLPLHMEVLMVVALRTAVW